MSVGAMSGRRLPSACARSTSRDDEREHELARAGDALEAVRARQRDLLEAAVAARAAAVARSRKSHEPVPRVVGLQALLGERRERLHAVLEQRLDELLLVREAAVDRADADARAAARSRRA